MQRQPDIAQGKQRGGQRIIIGTRLFHYRQIDARLFQRRHIRQRQLQFLSRVARRVQVEAPGVDEVGVIKQFARRPVREIVAVVPLGEKVIYRGGFDAKEINVDARNVERQYRQPLGQTQRKQRAAAGETHHRLNIVRGERLAKGRS